MSYVNNYQCCGNLTSEPALSEHGGQPYTKFVLALNKPGQKKPTYVDCIAWGDLSLRIVDHCTRGTEVFLSGELETSNYVDARGSHHKSTSLRIEKFSISKRGRGEAEVALPKPTV